MRRRPQFLLRYRVILGALAYMLEFCGGQSVVYFVTPSELRAQPVAGKAYRLGGMVQPGSLKWEPRSLDLAFVLSDGKASVPVRHKGTPPDLFAEARGAGVEGPATPEGYVKAPLIMAKHSEEYKAPGGDQAQAGYKELLKTLKGQAG